MNKDFETLKKEVSWFFKASDRIDFLPSENSHEVSEVFQKTFPTLTNLIQQARILNIIKNNQRYRLFSWTNKNDFSCGWLNKIEEKPNGTSNLIEDHRLLIKEIGGIQETYNSPEPSLCNNQNFMFIETDCTRGIGGWEEYYNMMCEEENKTQMDFKDFICFAKEANGDVTLYNPENKEVLLFAHDHSYDNVEFLENQPEYTFHKINNITYFVDYVEALAAEWENDIKSRVANNI